MQQHGIVKCSCGRVLFQCRCPGPHAVDVRAKACEDCRAEANETQRIELMGAKACQQDVTRLAEYLKTHFGCAWENRARHKTLVDLVMTLLDPLRNDIAYLAAPTADDGAAEPDRTYY